MAKLAKKTAKKSPQKKAPLAKAKIKTVAKSVKKSPEIKKVTPKKQTPGAKVAPRGPDRERFTLYGNNFSGPSYTVALMLALAHQPVSYIHVNLREGQHKMPDFLVKNRYGQVPALRDGQNFFVQSAAILDYLSETLAKFNGKTPQEKSRIKEWLFWMWDDLALPIYRLRGRNRGYRQFGDEMRQTYEREAKSALTLLDGELSRSEWLVGKKPTIADINAYGIVRYASEALIDLQAYPHIVTWKARIEALPGFALPEQILPAASKLL